MKRSIFSFLLILLTGSTLLGQNIKARIEKVRGYVIITYSKCSERYYCQTSSVLLLDKDTIPFFADSRLNADYINAYPTLRKAIGRARHYRPSSFSRRKDLFEGQYNLNEASFNKQDTDVYGRPVVTSWPFNEMKGSNCLYSMCLFSGEVVIYQGLSPMGECKEKIQHPNSFAILKKSEKIEKIDTPFSIKRAINRSNIAGIYLRPENTPVKLEQ